MPDLININLGRSIGFQGHLQIEPDPNCLEQTADLLHCLCQLDLGQLVGQTESRMEQREIEKQEMRK